MDHAADPVFWIAPDARVVYANSRACEQLGYSREELLAMTVHHFDPDFPAEVWPKHWEELKRRGSMTFESRHRTKDGRLFPVEITVNYLAFAGKEYNCASARDISDRKRAEEALARERANLRAVFDVVNVGMLVIDEDGAVKQVNDTLSRWVRKDVLAWEGGNRATSWVASMRWPIPPGADTAPIALHAPFATRSHRCCKPGSPSMTWRRRQSFRSVEARCPCGLKSVPILLSWTASGT